MRLVLGLAAVCLTLLAAPASANCVDEVQTSMARFAEARPVRITSTIQSMDGAINVVTEIARGAMHGRREAGGVVSEYTVLGDRAWTKEGGSWTELPADKAAGFAAALKAGSAMTFEGIRECEALGAGPHGASQSYQLSFFDAGVEVRAVLRTRADVKLPIALQIWGSDEKSITISQFSYDADVTVEAPAGFSQP
jgi:hypothetical protein